MSGPFANAKWQQAKDCREGAGWVLSGIESCPCHLKGYCDAAVGMGYRNNAYFTWYSAVSGCVKTVLNGDGIYFNEEAPYEQIEK